MSTEHPKDGPKRAETPAGAESAELADEQLQDASGGMIFVQIPSMGDSSIKTKGYDTPSKAEGRFVGKYFVQGVSHS
jgi:hypothetical protein